MMPTDKMLGAFSQLPVAQENAGGEQTGGFVLDLCVVASPVDVPQPKSPHLKRLKFFFSRRQEGGRERWWLHLGYFSSSEEAQKWLQLLRGVYPNAIAAEIPGTHRSLSAGSASAQPISGAANTSGAEEPTLTETQVLSILERRRFDGRQSAGGETGSDISLLRPEDTVMRRALKDAVVRNQPVSFAVQLLVARLPIDLESVQRHPIFRMYTVYTTETHRDGTGCSSLRLGFFSDAIAAKQIAHYMQSEYADVAVVPVSHEEQERALEFGHTPAVLTMARQHQRQEPEAQRPPAHTPEPAAQAATVSPSRPARPVSTSAAKASSRRVRSLEETLDELRSESHFQLDNEDAASTGVRHLKVEVQKDARVSWLNRHKDGGGSAPKRK